MTTQEPEFAWRRVDAFALANVDCAFCKGDGLKLGREGKPLPCKCVLRAIFRACYARFLYCSVKTRQMTGNSFAIVRARNGRYVTRYTRSAFGQTRSDENYVVDFCLVSRRHSDDFHHNIFRLHFLLGADWKICCDQLKIDQGTFFHAVYRIQHQLGRVFRELQPYSLYPLDEYFGEVVRRAIPTPDSGAGDRQSPAMAEQPIEAYA
jgi:hypothetical protein